MGVAETALREWIKKGKLAFVPVGNRRLIYWPTLLAFLANGETVDTTPHPIDCEKSRGDNHKTST